MTRLASEQILDLQQPSTWCDRAIEVVLAITLLFTPAALGTTEPWSQQIWFALIAVLAMLMTLNLVTNRQSQVVWTWAYVPIVAYLLLVALSVITLPASVLNVISPGTIREKAALLGDLPNVAELTASSTISFEVGSTLRGLRLVAALSVLFIVAVNTFRTPQQIKRLLIMIVGAGTAVTLLTLAQDFTAEQGTIYWVLKWDVQSPHPRSGPFFGHAMLGQYLNLTLGATVALSLVLIGEAFHGEDLAAGEIWDRLGEPQLRIVYVLLVIMGAMVIANALAVSRGALIGMAVAGVVAVTLILIKRGWRRGETPAVIGALAMLTAIMVVGVVFVVIPQIMKGRGYNIDESLNARRDVREQADDMIGKWPVMGTGLESFEWVFPWFQPAKSSRNIMDHAENDYLQTLTDTGVVGGVVTAAFLAIIAFNWVKAFRGNLPIHLASIGVAFGLTAVLVHSAADFAQRTPAIAMLSALLCAITISLARIHTRRVPVEASPQFGFSLLPRLAMGIIMIAAMGWAIWSIQGVRIGDANYWISDPLYTGDLDPRDPNDDQDLVKFFDRRIADTQLALQHDPKVVRYIHFLNDFRWRKLTRQRDPKTLKVVYPADAAEQARQIVKELSDARALCPTYGPLYILQGKIQWELFDKEQGRKLLQRGYDLKPFDPEVNFYLAEAAAEEGDWDTAVRWARDCFRQERWYDKRIMDLFLKRYDQPDKAFEVFKDDAFGLSFLATSLPQSNKELHAKVSALSIAMLIKQVEQKPGDAQGMVQLAERLDAAGRKAEAAEYVSRAVQLEYSRTDWRLYKARLLGDLGRTADAISETELVLRSQPHSGEAKALLNNLQDPKRKKAP